MAESEAELREAVARIVREGVRVERGPYAGCTDSGLTADRIIALVRAHDAEWGQTGRREGG